MTATPPLPGFFVTGTDTGIGKTCVAVGLLQALQQRGYRACGLKPVAAGCDDTAAGRRNEDAVALQRASSITLPYETVNPYALGAAVAPHIAAAEEGVDIALTPILESVSLAGRRADCVLVEGVGGWKVPLGAKLSTVDLARALALPAVLVVGLRLGCINHGLLTADAIEASGLPLAGWVANTIDADMQRLPENVETLRARLGAPFLGQIPHLATPLEGLASYLDPGPLEPLLSPCRG